jgi:hypothetical protein
VPLVTAAGIHAASSHEFATPIFKLAVAPDGSLLVADAGAGIVELRKGVGSLVAKLERVTDVGPIGRGDMFALRGGGPGLTTGALFRVSRGSTRLIADLYQFEADNNPHPTAVDSNVGVEVRNGGDAPADAGGNDLPVVDQTESRLDCCVPKRGRVHRQPQEPRRLFHAAAGAAAVLRPAAESSCAASLHECGGWP